jgi:hypothetical protein
MFTHRRFRLAGAPLFLAYIGVWFVAGIVLELAREFL